MKNEQILNEQILKKAIEKAIKGGLPASNPPRQLAKSILNAGNQVYFGLIFSHDFAKAEERDFFGVDGKDKKNKGKYILWQGMKIYKKEAIKKISEIK